MFGYEFKRRERSFVYRSYKDNFLGKSTHGRSPKRIEDQIRKDTRMSLMILERIAVDR